MKAFVTHHCSLPIKRPKITPHCFSASRLSGKIWWKNPSGAGLRLWIFHLKKWEDRPWCWFYRFHRGVETTNMWVECISTKDPRSRNHQLIQTTEMIKSTNARSELCRGFSWLLQGYTLGSSPGELPGCQKSFGRTCGSSPVMGSWWSRSLDAHSMLHLNLFHWVTTPKFTTRNG